MANSACSPVRQVDLAGWPADLIRPESQLAKTCHSNLYSVTIAEEYKRARSHVVEGRSIESSSDPVHVLLNPAGPCGAKPGSLNNIT